MSTYAYRRVSTDRQDVANQRHGIFEYANARGLGPLRFVEDAASGWLAWAGAGREPLAHGDRPGGECSGVCRGELHGALDAPDPEDPGALHDRHEKEC